eukprot:7381089-Prymnesium_polylepis.1
MAMKVNFEWDPDPDLAIDYPANFAFSSKMQRCERKIGESIEPAFGKPVMRSGQHIFTFTINKSWNNKADSLVLGVCDADKEKIFTDWKGAMDPNNGVAWGLYTICGKLMRCIDVTEKNGAGHGKNLMIGHLGDRAKGATVTLYVDMDAKTLEFKVNAGEKVDAEIPKEVFPAALRPWMLVGNADTISLGGSCAIARLP